MKFLFACLVAVTFACVDTSTALAQATAAVNNDIGANAQNQNLTALTIEGAKPAPSALIPFQAVPGTPPGIFWNPTPPPPAGNAKAIGAFEDVCPALYGPGDLGTVQEKTSSTKIIWSFYHQSGGRALRVGYRLPADTTARYVCLGTLQVMALDSDLNVSALRVAVQNFLTGNKMHGPSTVYALPAHVDFETRVKTSGSGFGVSGGGSGLAGLAQNMLLGLQGGAAINDGTAAVKAGTSLLYYVVARVEGDDDESVSSEQLMALINPPH